MPNRILRDWTDSDKVNQLSTEAEVFFVRLIMKADDYGVFYADPNRIKSACYPLKDSIRNTDITRWQEECLAVRLVRCFEANGGRYMCINNFDQRLRQMRRRFPTPPDESVSDLSASRPPPADNPSIPFVSDSDSLTDSDLDTEEEPPEPEHLLSGAVCVYCGSTEQQVGRRHEKEHFKPRCVGGSDEPGNMLLACRPCNGAKQGRDFKTVDDCRAWLHWRFWGSPRKRYQRHRVYAFGGKPPTGERIEKALKLHTETVAQPNNSTLLGTSPGRGRSRGFPVTPDDAIAQCGLQMNTRDFILQCYDKGASRGGLDAKGQEIRDFPAYVRISWKYEQDRIGREQNANHGNTYGKRDGKPANPKPDYSKGF